LLTPPSETVTTSRHTLLRADSNYIGELLSTGKHHKRSEVHIKQNKYQSNAVNYYQTSAM